MTPTPQYDLFSVHQFENTPANQSMLDANRDHFSNQCRKVFDLLMRGEALTSINAQGFGIGDIRARVRDLIKFNGVKITVLLMENSRNKQWMMTQEDKQFNERHVLGK